MRLPNSELSRAILIGSSTFVDVDLPELPRVLHGIADFAGILTAPEGTGLRRENCLQVLNESSLAIVGEHLEAFATSASDVLIVYYAGHGVLDPQGELYLALTDTRIGRLAWTAIPVARIRRIMAESPARTRVLMLDCCFSGRAIETMSDLQSAVTAELKFDGAYTLTSAPANSPAFAPAGDRYTAFTGELIQLLEAGASDSPELLTLSDIYRLLHRRLAARGLPLPQQRNTNHARSIALVPNYARILPSKPDHSEKYGAIWLRAKDGDTESMYQLGLLLRRDRNESDAAAWFQEAARLDHEGAMVELAAIHETAGRLEQTELWLRRASDGENDHALLQTAEFMHRRGRTHIAAAYFRRSANLGNSASMNRLAALLRREGKNAEAEEWIQKAHESLLHGLDAQTQSFEAVNPNEVRNSKESVYGLVQRADAASDPVQITAIASQMEDRGLDREAELYYRRAAEQNHGDAMFHLGVLLEDQRRPSEAENWYRAAAETNHAEAMYRLGIILDRRGTNAGEEWLRRASKAGHPDGMFALALILLRRGDQSGADELLEMAADQKHAAAMNALGFSLAKRDKHRAKYLYEQAARLGNTSAMNNLGLLLLDDDVNSARGWFVRAAQHGNVIAIENVENLQREGSG